MPIPMHLTQNAIGTLQLYREEDVIPTLREIIPFLPKGILDLSSFLQEQKLHLSAQESRLIAMAAKLRQGVSFRFLRGCPTFQWQRLEQLLHEQFPQFSEVTEIIRGACHLSWVSGTQLRIPPLLLLGDPGLGKTFYVRLVARTLGLEYRAISMATVTAGFVLAGMDSGWSDAKPGLVYQQLLNGKSANPVLLLDELDKVHGDGHRYDPHGPLYSLLEEHSAREFRDEFFPLPINASQIQWVATANRAEDIPEPILSRMQVVEIPEPTLEQRRRMVPYFYANLLEESAWGRAFDIRLSDRVIDSIVERCTTPRAMRKALEQACFRSAREKGLQALRETDASEMPVSLWLSVDDLKSGKCPEPAFGFTPRSGPGKNSYSLQSKKVSPR
jgi:ATP-dependent Lon protease